MRCPRQLYQNLLLHLEFVMASVCKICAGPIWIIISIASPAWAWPTPRRRWTSPTVDFAPGPPRCGSRPVRGGAHCRQRAAGEPPLSWRRERRLAVPSNPTVASFPDFLPRGLFPPPFQHRGIRSLWPRGGRRGHVHLGLGEGGVGRIGARAIRQLRAFRRSS